MENAALLDKFKGSMVGFAAGDALGAPMEGLVSGETRREHGFVTDYLDGRWGPGGITYRTQMMVCVAQAIIETGRFDGDHSSRKMGEWIRSSDEGVKEAREPETACETACRSIYREGPSPKHSIESSSCGAAMRATPVGLRYYHEPEELKRFAVAQARITHLDRTAAAGSVVVARAVALGVSDEGQLDREGMIEQLSSSVRVVDQAMAVKIAGLTNYVDATSGEGFDYTGTGPESSEAVPAALLAFMRSPYDFEQAVATAVNAGGDAASIGALAGAISGAFNGIERMPGRWRDGLEGRAYLESLAFRLYTLTPARGPKTRPSR